MYKFSDIKTQSSILVKQIEGINASVTLAFVKAGGDATCAVIPGLLDIVKAQRALVNRIGKFYGLRSKYDGRGNLRTPIKAA